MFQVSKHLAFQLNYYFNTSLLYNDIHSSDKILSIRAHNWNVAASKIHKTIQYLLEIIILESQDRSCFTL